MPSAQNIVITDGTTPITLIPRQVAEVSVFENTTTTFNERTSLATSNRLAKSNAPQKTRMSLKEPTVETVDGKVQVVRQRAASIELLSDPSDTPAEREAFWDRLFSLGDNADLKAQFVNGEKFFG